MPAQFAHGAELHMGDGGTPETFTKVPCPGDFSFKPPQPERIDVTNHDSAAREYLQGLGADGEVTTEFFYDPAETMHAAVRAKHGVSAPTNWELHFASGDVATFAATVSVEFTLPISDAEKMSVTLAISGAVTWS